jgi:hypothetical protein
VEPIYKNSPNLYENFVICKTNVASLTKRLEVFLQEVGKFKVSLGNYPNEDNPSFDQYDYGRHKHFMDDYSTLDADFLEAKFNMFSYSEALLPSTKFKK